MKGCFRTCFYCPFMYDADSINIYKAQHCGLPRVVCDVPIEMTTIAYSQDECWIPAHLVQCVRVFENSLEHFQRTAIMPTAVLKKSESYIILMREMCAHLKVPLCTVCPQDVEVEWDENTIKPCACGKSPIFPLYEITVKNHASRDYIYDDDDCGGKIADSFIPRTRTYILHPSEREHIERYLAGTDDLSSSLPSQEKKRARTE